MEILGSRLIGSLKKGCEQSPSASNSPTHMYCMLKSFRKACENVFYSYHHGSLRLSKPYFMAGGE